jgi:integrase
MPNYPGKLPGRRRITIYWKGKQREWVIEGTKRQGDEFEARKRLELQVKDGPIERRVAVSFLALSLEYAVFAKQHLKKSTWQSRKFQIDALTTHMGDVPVSELSKPHVEAFKLKRLEDELKASSINNELRVFGTLLRWGREMGHTIPEFRWSRLPERGKPRVKAFTSLEIERIWTACRAKAPSLLPILVFLLNTGCRKGEALAAEWDWMDFDAGMIRIPSNEHWQPKNGLPREVPMSDAVRALLSGIKARPKRDKRYVFEHRFGGPLAQFPKELWGYVMKEARLSGGPHQLRHTFASHFLAATKDIKLLAEVLGHSQTRVTELYAHLLPGHLERARNAVNIAPTLVEALAGGSRKSAKRA